jgi:hypothetical protein
VLAGAAGWFVYRHIGGGVLARVFGADVAATLLLYLVSLPLDTPPSTIPTGRSRRSSFCACHA